MATTILRAIAFAYVDQENPDAHYAVNNNTWYTLSGAPSALNEKALLVQFSPIPASLKRKALVGVEFEVAADATGSEAYTNTVYLNTLANPIDLSSATYTDLAGSGRASGGLGSVNTPDGQKDITVRSTSPAGKLYDAKRLASNPYACLCNSNSYAPRFVKVRPTLVAGGLMYATLEYDATRTQTSKIVYKSGPKSGYVNPRTATGFQWAFEPADSTIDCADNAFSQASATFYWKASTAANYTAVNISGSTAAVTIPANTFPAAATIQWYVSGTDEDGTTTQTDVFSFSTAAGAVSAVCVSPNLSVEDGSAAIDFVWRINSTDGQAASRVRGIWRKSSDPDEDASYNVLFDVSSALTSYSAPANTFPAGDITWRVRVWNIDGTEGAAGSTTFICVAAPEAPAGLAATEVPLTTISWQSGEQQAYEISIDGNVVRRAFGSDVYSWQVPEPLAEGDHVISVRVQGIYGFLSQPSEITITVGGPESVSMTISGTFGADAELHLNLMTSSDVRWYRDGALIGISKNGAPDFTDRRVLGSHEYFARIFYPYGGYMQSNTITGSMSVRAKQISALDDYRSPWIQLRLSENSADEEQFTWSRGMFTQHIAATGFPTLERSGTEDLVGTYNCAFVSESDAANFETLAGKVVILKSRQNNVITGMLAQVQKRVTEFYITYDFSIQQIYAADYVEIDSI